MIETSKIKNEKIKKLKILLNYFIELKNFNKSRKIFILLIKYNELYSKDFMNFGVEILKLGIVNNEISKAEYVKQLEILNLKYSSPSSSNNNQNLRNYNLTLFQQLIFNLLQLNFLVKSYDLLNFQIFNLPYNQDRLLLDIYKILNTFKDNNKLFDKDNEID